MKDSFKDKFLSTLIRSTSYKTIEELEEYVTILEAIQQDTTIKLNRIKSTFLNCDYLNDILYIDVSPLSKDVTISHDIIDRIRDITLKYPKDDKIIEQLFIIEKLIDNIDDTCNHYNKYITLIGNLKNFLARNDIDPTNIKRPNFKVFKDRNLNPVLFFTPYNEENLLTSYIFNGEDNFSIDYTLEDESMKSLSNKKIPEELEKDYLDMCTLYFKTLLS